MFTGIIEDLGKVEAIKRFRDKVSLTISTKFLKEIKTGDSISVNGVCLTVTEKLRSSFSADVTQETVTRSSLTYLKVGEFVNLERAMPATGRFDGHMVQGHVDCRSLITNIVNNGDAKEIEVSVPEKYSKYVTEKGSVAVDGVSLTISDAGRRSFRIAIIPHTAINTNLFYKKIGDWVNVEFDVIAKYLEKLLSSRNSVDLSAIKDMKIDMEFLKNAGFLN